MNDKDFRIQLSEIAPRLRTYARRLCNGDGPRAEDIAQQALLKAWANRDQFQPGTSLQAWCLRITFNVFATDRKRPWRQREALDEDISELAGTATADADNRLDLDEVRRALAELPPEQRQALVLVAVGGLSYEQAGALLKISSGTVKSRVSRGRARLAAVLAEGALGRDGVAPSAALDAIQWDEILVPPQLARALVEGAANPPHSPDTRGAMAAVLLVEDEFLVRELIEEAFKDEGLTVHASHDGASALASVASECPAILVTDINLGPGLDGFELARRARQARPDLKVVYITGHAAHLAQQGVPDALMIPKPFDPTKLALQVRRWLAQDAPPGPSR